MRTGIVIAGAALLLAAGCPKERAKAKPPGGDATPMAPVAIDAAAAPPAALPFTAAPVPIVAPDVVAATFDWNRPTMTVDELEDALDDGDADEVDAVRRRGAIVVTSRDAWVEQFDAKAGRAPYRGAGLLGLDLDLPVAFTDAPSLMRGEMPMGGHVRLHTGYLLGTLALDAAGTEALRAQLLDDDPLVTQYLIELGQLGKATDDSGEEVTVLHATLLGVRVVQLGARRTYLEGKPARPLRAAP